MSYLKPQTPLQHKDGDYFYPLTTIDQIIMEDGVTRLNGADLVSVNTDGAPEGETAGINADTLGGYAADAYIRQDSSKALLSVNLNEIVNGTASPTNADMLGNVPAEEYAKLSDLDDATSMELLWENASPTSEFSPQKISLNIEDGDLLYIIPILRTDANAIFPGTLAKLGEEGYITLVYTEIFIRVFSVATDGVNFGGTYYIPTLGNPTLAHNDYAIPFRIYRIKEVSA